MSMLTKAFDGFAPHFQYWRTVLTFGECEGSVLQLLSALVSSSCSAANIAELMLQQFLSDALISFQLTLT